MKNLVRFTVFALFIWQGLHAATQISLDRFKKEYSLVIVVVDQARTKRIALVAGDSIFHQHKPFLTELDFVYNPSLLDELAEFWQEIVTPEDIGCYRLKSCVSKNRVFFNLWRFLDTSAHEYYVSIDSCLTVTDMLLVPTMLLNDCSLKKHRMNIENDVVIDLAENSDVPQSFEGLLSNADEAEVCDDLHNTKSPSKLLIYARQIGVALLFKYLDFKDYLIKKWYGIKHMWHRVEEAI